MKLSKKQQKDAQIIYNNFWESYLSGDIESMGLLLSDDFNVIGSTTGEVFRNKEEVLNYYKDTADQIKNKLEFRNRNVELVNYDQFVLFNEHSDAYILIDNDWTFYAKVRLSSILIYEKNEWKFVQQHGSIPDSKADDGEQIAFEKISKENLELRDAIKRRTIELENKSRELEIEAALERIRTIAMSMQIAEDLLEVVKTLNLELKTLGFTNIRNTIINIFDDAKEVFTNYDYSDYGVGGISEVGYYSHPSNTKFVNKIREGSTDFMITEFTGKELDEWKKWRSDVGQMPDSKLDQAKSLYYYEYSIGTCSIGITTFNAIDKAKLELLKRFRNVFKLSYQRYTDIEQAEIQARETEIELALERVRSRSIGMQKSDELKDVIKIIFDQLVLLNINAEHAGIVVDYTPKGDWNFWIAETQDIPARVSIPYLDNVWDRQFTEAKKKGKEFFSINLDFEEKNSFYQELLEYIPGLTKRARNFYFKCPGLAISTVIQKDIGLYMENFSGFPYSDEENDTLMRFGKVFQQTYTRFLDLQRAEAQVREAQIEAALERVRSRSMAMHKSEELSATAEVLFEQINLLGNIPDRMSIGIINEKSKNVELWVTDQGGNKLSHEFFFSLAEPTSIVKFYNAWKERKNSFIVDLTGQNLTDWLKFVKKNAKLPIDETQIIGRRVQQAAFFSQGFLLLTSHNPVNDEIMNLLVRFAKVFEQTYTRFLDLQKAEAQAREAKIEASLERVRSKAMAMHKSEDLTSAVAAVFAELDNLGLKTVRCGIGIFNDQSRKVNVWTASLNGSKETAHLSGDEILEGHPLLDKIFDAWVNQKVLSYKLEGKDLKEYYSVTAGSNFPVKAPEVINDETTQYYYCVMFPAGGLFAFRGSEFSAEAQILMKRFADVFQLSFTRHLDLKKAEAQAREAQIETALERVRARTMAMHNSQDVGATVVTLFEEVLKLGLNKYIRCGIGILNKETDHMETWSATSDSNGQVDLKMGLLDMRIHPMLIGLKQAWQKGEAGYNYDYIGDDVIKYYDALNKEPEYPFIRDLNTLPENEYHKSFFYPEGILFSFAPNPISDEAAKVLNRFASVFGQTYRRFLDLLKAEAQAREAQIEAALERVRARTMAMQKSNELAQTAAHLFDQLSELGIKPYRCNIAIVDQENDQCQLWSTTSHGNVIPVGTSIPLLENSVFQEMYDGWKSKRNGHVIRLVGKDRLTWTEYITKYVYFDEYKPRNVNKEKLLSEAAIFSNCYFKQGFFVIHTVEEVSETDLNIIQRFARVFEQTYTRFLDLENAEVQNKLIQEENERKTEELEEARKIQLAMLPKELPKMPGAEIAVYMETATEVGGDYYDFHVEEDGELTAVIGDATGHGMKAGTIVTVTKSLFNSLASDESILDTFKKISRVIKDMKFRQLSMCLMMIKLKENHLMLSSAAMPPALIYRRKNKRVDEILVKGMPLGAMINFPYSIEETNLERGDTILLMSDGFPELQNVEGEMYGYERTRTTLRSIGDKKPEEIVNHLKNSATEWLNGLDADDDVTFVVIKIN